MKNEYTLTESESDIVFAVIVADNQDTLIRLVELAIKEEFSYDKVTFINNSYSERSGTVFMSFNGVTDDDDIEVREIELSLTAIYTSANIKETDKDKLKKSKEFSFQMGLISLISGIFLLFYLYRGFVDKTLTINYMILSLLCVETLFTGFYYIKSLFDIKQFKNKIRCQDLTQ